MALISLWSLSISLSLLLPPLFTGFHRKSQLARDNCSKFFFLINQLGLQAIKTGKSKLCNDNNRKPVLLWKLFFLVYDTKTLMIFTWHDKPLTSSLLCKWCTLLYLDGTERIFYFWLALYQDRGYDLQIHYKVSTGHFFPFISSTQKIYLERYES